jgi:hypothetical protein
MIMSINGRTIAAATVAIILSLASAQAGWTGNGSSLNGWSGNGTTLNGWTSNGTTLNGRRAFERRISGSNRVGRERGSCHRH